MDLSEVVRAALQKAGYRCDASQNGDIVFEDDTLLGFVSVQESARDILAKWREKQEAFLRSFATPLRKDAGKAWNVYSVFVAGGKCAPQDAAALLEVEEDFVGTRKLARAGIATEDDVFEALYPLLPIEHTVALGEGNGLERAQRRLELPGEITDALTSDSELSLEDVADELVRRS